MPSAVLSVQEINKLPTASNLMEGEECIDACHTN